MRVQRPLFVWLMDTQLWSSHSRGASRTSPIALLQRCVAPLPRRTATSHRNVALSATDEDTWLWLEDKSQLPPLIARGQSSTSSEAEKKSSGGVSLRRSQLCAWIQPKGFGMFWTGVTEELESIGGPGTRMPKSSKHKISSKFQEMAADSEKLSFIRCATVFWYSKT